MQKFNFIKLEGQRFITKIVDVPAKNTAIASPDSSAEYAKSL